MNITLEIASLMLLSIRSVGKVRTHRKSPGEGFFPSLCLLFFLAEKAGTLIMRPLIPCEKRGGGFYVCVDGSRPSVFTRLMGATESTFSPYNKRRKGERHKSIRVLSCPTNHLSDPLMPIMSWSYTKNAIAHRRKTIQLGIGQSPKDQHNVGRNTRNSFVLNNFVP